MQDIILRLHLFSILPCAVLGTGLMLAKKGTGFHKITGRIYMVLIFFSAVMSLFLPAHAGPRLFNHFGFLHLLSILTIWTVPVSLYAAYTGNIRKHRSGMVSLYVGGIVIAGAFALSPGRFLHGLLFG